MLKLSTIFRQQNKRKNLPAFSLMEIIVSVAIFSFIIVIVTQIFHLVIEGQRRAVAAQNIQENLKYYLEMTAKEMRTAKFNRGFCPIIKDDEIYHVGENPSGVGKILYFRNYYDECVSYFLTQDSNSPYNTRFRIRRNTSEDWITPTNINVKDLQFVMLDGDYRPQVTTKIEAEIKSGLRVMNTIRLQTTVTSRYYKN